MKILLTNDDGIGSEITRSLFEPYPAIRSPGFVTQTNTTLESG